MSPFKRSGVCSKEKEAGCFSDLFHAVRMRAGLEFAHLRDGQPEMALPLRIAEGESGGGRALHLTLNPNLCYRRLKDEVARISMRPGHTGTELPGGQGAWG